MNMRTTFKECPDNKIPWLLLHTAPVFQWPLFAVNFLSANEDSNPETQFHDLYISEAISEKLMFGIICNLFLKLLFKKNGRCTCMCLCELVSMAEISFLEQNQNFQRCCVVCLWTDLFAGDITAILAFQTPAAQQDSMGHKSSSAGPVSCVEPESERVCLQYHNEP